MKLFGRVFTTAFLAAVGVMALPSTASADPPSPIPYRQAVAEAYEIVSTATPGDGQAANIALALVREGTGDTQPEIVFDLSRRPPNFNDAASRLKALLDALDDPATTDDPAAAQSRLHQVLSMSRYDALRRPPSALSRFVQWITDRLRELLRFLFGGSSIGGVVPAWVVYVIGLAGLAAVLFIVFRSATGRFGSYADLQLAGPHAPADFFAQADRLAAAGDFRLALRALCAGVAGTLAGERTWEGSPLTVREIFSRAPDPASLQPLLIPFEAAIYGGRHVDEATYTRAASVAARYRQPEEKAA